MSEYQSQSKDISGSQEFQFWLQNQSVDAGIMNAGEPGKKREKYPNLK